MNAYFFVANFLAGFVHYLFQVYAGRTLTVIEFGKFNSWFAILSVLTMIGIFIQYFPNLFHIQKNIFKLALFSFITLGIFFVIRILSAENLTVLEVSCWYILCCVGFGFIFGIAQSHFYFVIIATSTLIQAISKLLYAYSNSNDSLGFYIAPAFSYVPAMIPFLFLLKKPLPKIEKLHNFSSASFGTLMLAFITVYIPQMDILIVKMTQSDQRIGEFARVSLFYKAVFFFFFIVAQMLLPKQSQAGSLIQNIHIKIKDVLYIFFLGVLTASISVFVYAPITKIVFNTNLETPTSWVFFSLLHITFLTFIFFKAQIFIAKKHLTDAFILCSFLILESVILSFLELEISLTLGISCVLEFIMLIGLSIYQNIKE